MTRQLFQNGLATLLTIIIGVATMRAAADTQVIDASVVSGGGMLGGGTIEVRATVGQPDAGVLSGETIQIIGGVRQDEPPPPPCPGDATGDGTTDVEDLVAVIVAWGPCTCAADLNDDGTVNVEDLVAVIVAWGPCG